MRMSKRTPHVTHAPGRAPLGHANHVQPDAIARRRPVRSALLWAAAVYVPTLGLLFALLWLGRRFDVPFAVLSRDVSDVAGTAFYGGALSILGGVLFCAAAAVALFAFAVTRGVAAPVWSRFLLGWGLLSLMLGCDDLFMLHEALFPLVLGVPELVILAVHATVALTCLAVSWRVLPLTSWPLLVGAAAFFAVSLVVDLHLWEVAEENIDFLEDGPKLLGIVGFSAYLIGTARDVARASVRNVARAASVRTPLMFTALDVTAVPPGPLPPNPAAPPEPAPRDRVVA